MLPTPTSRPSWAQTPPPIELSEPMPGLAHFILRLTQSPHLQNLSELVAGNQLAVSASGLHAALHMPEDATSGRVYHTSVELTRLPFLRRDEAGQQIATRVLWVDEQAALVWGQPVGHPHAGVWLLTSEEASELMPLDELLAVYTHEPGGVYAGKLHDQPGQTQLVTKSGRWPVADGSQVTTLYDGSLLILEKLGLYHYAYRLTKDGTIENYSYVPCGPGEVPVQVLRWGDRFFLVLRTGENESVMREFGTATSGPMGETPIQGIVEAAWNAPGFNSIAVLSRLRSRSGWYRRLELNGVPVYEGRFLMERDALQWSEEGDAFAAVIQETGGSEDGPVLQKIVTPGLVQDVPRGRRVREMIVADAGLVPAMILTDGRFDYPVISSRKHTPVPYAWNLHRTPDGGTAYNSFHDQFLMRWKDSTDVQS